MKITFYAHTAQGKRAEQQDSFLVLDFPTTGQQIAAVADGMGGHLRGAEASRAAIEPLQQLFRPDAFQSEQEAIAAMRQVMRVADDSVTVLGFRDVPDAYYRSGPGSTLTVVTAHPKEPYQLVLGHIGDSRAYLLRPRENDGLLRIKQLTRDHSEGPYIDRALGNWDTDRSQRSLWQLDENGKPTPYDVGIVKVRTGDLILLCTDGIHGVLSDALIRDAVYISERSDSLPRAVVNCALNAGSTDNCTVVVGVVS